MTAIEQLKSLDKISKTYWCEHKPSITVLLLKNPNEFAKSWCMGVGITFDSISGISFLPFSEHTYRQAPYQDCTKKEYDELYGQTIPQDR